ncbi:uncharacterized protein LOC133629590 [Colius striatus]|uniref:uncharacterized protein LOC133629590 n=1 Tax=Colius striatus TaxID=57412 RepID=UPI002B1E6AD3|nr:uncharacterized protein LOC133629590 [Colius striatus]
MAGGRRVPLALLAVLALQGAGAVRVGNVLTQAEFYQRDENLQQEAAELLFDFDGDCSTWTCRRLRPSGSCPSCGNSSPSGHREQCWTWQWEKTTRSSRWWNPTAPVGDCGHSPAGAIPESESQGLEGTSKAHPVQPPARAGPPRAGHTGTHPAGFGMSPEKEPPQPIWAAPSRAPSPQQGTNSSSYCFGTSDVPACPRCPLSCHCPSLSTAWLQPPHTHP